MNYYDRNSIVCKLVKHGVQVRMHFHRDGIWKTPRYGLRTAHGLFFIPDADQHDGAL